MASKGMKVGTSWKQENSITLPKTNIAGWKIHHFDGIFQDFDGDFHGLLLLVSGRVSKCIKLQPLLLQTSNKIHSLKLTASLPLKMHDWSRWLSLLLVSGRVDQAIPDAGFMVVFQHCRIHLSQFQDVVSSVWSPSCSKKNGEFFRDSMSFEVLFLKLQQKSNLNENNY